VRSWTDITPSGIAFRAMPWNPSQPAKASPSREPEKGNTDAAPAEGSIQKHFQYA
jgi:hypothetical protein